MRRRLSLMLVLVVLQVVVLASASVAAVGRWMFLPLAGDDPYVLLIMGSDMGPPSRAGDVFDGRADIVQLLVVDAAREHVSIVSFPRDTWIPVQGRGNARINELLLPGPDAAMRTMENLTGLQVNDWIVTGFAGFMGGINDFGGVNVDVERRLTNTGNSHVNLEAGPQRLDGREALGYTRDRKSRPQGDIDRAGAAASALRALHRDVRDRATSPNELVSFVGILRANTASSLTLQRMLQLGTTALAIDPGNVVQTTVPVRLGRAGSASVVFLQPGAERIFAELREHGTLPAHRE